MPPLKLDESRTHFPGRTNSVIMLGLNVPFGVRNAVSVLSPQKSIKEPVSVSGKGLFTGAATTLTFKPAPVGHGIVFVRTDLSRPVRIPALVQHVTKRSRRTAIKSGADSVETIEHCMSAIAGLSIDNLEIDITGGERCQEMDVGS